MNIEINVDPRQSTNAEFVKVEINLSEGEEGCILDFDYKTLRKRFYSIRYEPLEFLYFTLIVYAIDKIISREESDDNWTRLFNVTIPVRNPDDWNAVSELLSDSISFLTGDRWAFRFTEQNFRLGRPPYRRQYRSNLNRVTRPQAVSLFSGGLDSLVGAINWLEENPKSSIFVVGHYDGDVSGTRSIQEALLNILNPLYPRRIEGIHLRAGQTPVGKDTNFRSRSLLFIGLGILCANQFNQELPLLIPENGTISLNVALNPSRRGSLSTRTCHPYFLDGLRKILNSLNFRNPLINPLADKTKGEIVEKCLDQEVLNVTAPISFSCAKSVRNRNLCTNKNAKACGRCVPCIFRRAALNKIDLDQDDYCFDICSVDENTLSDYSKEGWNDLRAILSFLRRNYSNFEIGQKLIAGGKLEITKVSDYADLVARAMNEIRQLLEDKGNDYVKSMAGIIS
jgi:hypothetical protein